MKLELKHLAGYLPYGLKGYCTDDMQGQELMIGLNEEQVFTDKDPMDIVYFKPILRPLSDLTKEIEVNEERFVPTKKFNDTRKWEGSPLAMTEHIIHNLKEDNLPTWLTKKLLEWHFDIYGLIEAKLAIDINTLDKQP